MNINKAAENALLLMTRWAEIPSDMNPLAQSVLAGWDPCGLSLGHIVWMLHEIIEDRVVGERAHRWLGYAQGLMAARGIATLEQLKCANLFS